MRVEEVALLTALESDPVSVVSPEHPQRNPESDPELPVSCPGSEAWKGPSHPGPGRP